MHHSTSHSMDGLSVQAIATGRPVPEPSPFTLWPPCEQSSPAHQRVICFQAAACCQAGWKGGTNQIGRGQTRESQQRDDRGSTGPPQRPCQSCLDWSSGSGPWRPLFPPALPAVVLVSQARPKSDPRQVRADDVTRCKSSQLQLGKLCDPDDDSGGRPLFAGPRQARQRRAVNFSGRSTMQDAG